MGRKPSGYKPPKPSEQPAPRNFGFESIIVAAINGRHTISYICERGEAARVMEPYILYYSGTGKVLVGGNQIENPNDRAEINVWRTPEVGGLISVQAGTRSFTVDPRFNRADKRYSKGVLAAVSRL